MGYVKIEPLLESMEKREVLRYQSWSGERADTIFYRWLVDGALNPKATVIGDAFWRH